MNMTRSYDLWINLMSPPDFSELGEAVYDALMKVKPKEGHGNYREIKVGGS